MSFALTRAIAAWLVLATVAVLFVIGSCSTVDPYRKLNVGTYTCTQAKAGDPWTCQ